MFYLNICMYFLLSIPPCDHINLRKPFLFLFLSPISILSLQRNFIYQGITGLNSKSLRSFVAFLFCICYTSAPDHAYPCHRLLSHTLNDIHRWIKNALGNISRKILFKSRAITKNDFICIRKYCFHCIFLLDLVYHLWDNILNSLI